MTDQLSDYQRQNIAIESLIRMRETKFGPYREITIGAKRQFVVKVSPEDYDYLVSFLWTYMASHAGRYDKCVYARRCITVEGKKLTLLMHTVVLERKYGKAYCDEQRRQRKTCDHRNRNGLDNRRPNLRYASASTQGRNK